MKVGIIGAGTMGQGIAKAFAQVEGYEVALCDIKQEWADGGKDKIAKGYARLGEKGRGFEVVANEIQNLSDSTKKTTTQVTSLNEQIEEKLKMTIDNSHKTLAVTEDQSAAMEELYASVHSLVDLAETLKTLFAKDE